MEFLYVLLFAQCLWLLRVICFGITWRGSRKSIFCAVVQEHNSEDALSSSNGLAATKKWFVVINLMIMLRVGIFFDLESKHKKKSIVILYKSTS
jgi:hypothetical protein